MGLKLEWNQYDVLGVKEDRWDAGCAGYDLTAQTCARDRGMWEGLVTSGGGRVLGGSLHFRSGPLPTLDAAQEAAEAATARLLAEDAGVRALMGLRWIPVSEGLPDEGVEVQVAVSGRGQYVATYRSTHPEHCTWTWGFLESGMRLVFDAEDVTHWRPLPDGPEVPT